MHNNLAFLHNQVNGVNSEKNDRDAGLWDIAELFAASFISFPCECQLSELAPWNCSLCRKTLYLACVLLIIFTFLEIYVNY